MSQLSDLQSILGQMADRGCPAVVLSYGFAAEVESLMADDLVPFFQHWDPSPSGLSLTDVILEVKWDRLAHILVVDLDAKEFSMVGTLPAELRVLVEDIARWAGYAVSE